MYQYYFSLLNAEQKNIYKSLLNGIHSFSSEIKIPLRPADEISKIFGYIRLDNPMIFYVSSYRYTSELHRQRITFMPDYKYSKNTVKSHNTDIARYLTVHKGGRMSSNNNDSGGGCLLWFIDFLFHRHRNKKIKEYNQQSRGVDSYESGF